MAIWRLIALNNEQMLMDPHIAYAIQHGNLRLEIDYMALNTGIDMCKSILATYPTDLKKDKRLLNSPKLSQNAKNAMQLRVSEKEAYWATLKFAEMEIGRIINHISPEYLDQRFYYGLSTIG